MIESIYAVREHVKTLQHYTTAVSSLLIFVPYLSLYSLIIFAPYLWYRTFETMPDTRSCLWLAMPPTALLCLASLLTYLAFRLTYLATARNIAGNSQNGDAANIQLRTLALPWIFFVLEMIILCMNTRSQQNNLRHWYMANNPSTQRATIHAPNHSHQTGHPRTTTSTQRRCSKCGRPDHDLQRGPGSCHGHCQGCVCSRLPSGSVSGLRLRRRRFDATTECCRNSCYPIPTSSLHRAN
jgi:hypothetical protein